MPTNVEQPNPEDLPDSQPRPEVFPFEAECDEFSKILEEHVRRQLEKVRSSVMSEENILHYSHGGKWLSHSRPDETTEHSFKMHATEVSVRLSEIADHRINTLLTYIDTIVKGMHQTFMTEMYSTVGNAAERVGNVVDGKSLRPAEAFLEALRKVEFGVDRSGRVSRPEVHLGSAAYTAMMNDLRKQGPEFFKTVQELTEQKVADALATEARRRSRFTRDND